GAPPRPRRPAIHGARPPRSTPARSARSRPSQKPPAGSGGDLGPRITAWQFRLSRGRTRQEHARSPVVSHRAGSADLPLHGGRVPPWLAQRMTALGTVICEAIVHHYGRDELLRRLAHPFWFQSFGAVMGMDWHSSGITTSVLGALKRGLAP